MQKFNIIFQLMVREHIKKKRIVEFQRWKKKLFFKSFFIIRIDLFGFHEFQNGLMVVF